MVPLLLLGVEAKHPVEDVDGICLALKFISCRAARPKEKLRINYSHCGIQEQSGTSALIKNRLWASSHHVSIVNTSLAFVTYSTICKFGHYHYSYRVIIDSLSPTPSSFIFVFHCLQPPFQYMPASRPHLETSLPSLHLRALVSCFKIGNGSIQMLQNEVHCMNCIAK